MNIGQLNTLKAARTTDNGCYLMDADGEEVLLPNAYVSDSLKLGDEIEVFIYLDNDERPVATTLTPKVTLDSFACLEVMDVNKAGAFLDMGVVKQLMVPYSEQVVTMEAGERYVIFCLLDDQTNRLIASSKVEDFLFTEDLDVEEGDEVEALIYKRSDLGTSAVVNNQYQGLIFKSDVHQDLKTGDKIKAFIKTIRPDGKIDLVLQRQGYRNAIDSTTQKVLDELNKQGGEFKYTDKSDPDEIRRVFKMSKKTFKKALGNLYRQKIVVLEKTGTKLIK